MGLGREVALPDFPAHPVPVWGEETVVGTGWGGSSPSPCPSHLPGHTQDPFSWIFVFSAGRCCKEMSQSPMETQGETQSLKTC